MLELDVKESKSYQELKSIVLSNTFPWFIDNYGYTKHNFDFLKEIKGKEDTGVMFDGLHYHEAYFPKKDKRIVLVVNI